MRAGGVVAAGAPRGLRPPRLLLGCAAGDAVADRLASALAPLLPRWRYGATPSALLRAVRGWVPDLVLLHGRSDAVPPLAVLAALVAEPVLCDVPVVVVEAWDRGEARWHDVLGAGAREALPPGADPAVLQRVVAVALRDAARLREQREARRDAEERSARDLVTGAATRAVLRARLAAAEVTPAPGGGDGAGAVVVLDVDGFKGVNDAHGHLVGDAVLRAVADRLGRALRPEDLLVRWAGDEFVALLPGTGPAQALAVAERLLAAVAATPVAVAGQPVAVALSAGVASGPLREGERLLRQADAALLAAKAAGRGRALLAPAGPPG